MAGLCPAADGPPRVYVAHPFPHSHYELCNSGRFALHHAAASYLGTYTQSEGVLTLVWDVGGSWTATGVLTGTTLTIQYSPHMQLSDFEDGAYQLVTPAALPNSEGNWP